MFYWYRIHVYPCYNSNFVEPYPKLATGSNVRHRRQGWKQQTLRIWASLRGKTENCPISWAGLGSWSPGLCSPQWYVCYVLSVRLFVYLSQRLFRHFSFRSFKLKEFPFSRQIFRPADDLDENKIAVGKRVPCWRFNLDEAQRLICFCAKPVTTSDARTSNYERFDVERMAGFECRFKRNVVLTESIFFQRIAISFLELPDLLSAAKYLKRRTDPTIISKKGMSRRN